MTAVFTRMRIPAQRRILVDMFGQPLRYQDNTIVGDVAPGSSIIVHWLDPWMARAWIVFGRQKLTEAIAASTNDIVRAWDLLCAAAYALMTAYNALNISWYMDPVARAMYRRRIAGPPRRSNAFYAEFGDDNYNDTFSTHNGLWLQTGTAFSATIPDRARAIFARCMTDPSVAARHATQFLPHFQFYTNAAQGTSVSAATTVQNAQVLQNYLLPGVFPGGFGGCYEQIGTKVDRPTGQCDPRAIYPRQYQRGPACEARNTAEVKRWDTFQFDSNWTLTSQDAPQQATASIGDYSIWLDEWFTALENRDMVQVVLDARAYVVFYNAKMFRAFQGAASFFDAALRTADTNSTRDPAVQRDLQAIGATAVGVAAVIGAALAVPTAGISAGVAAIIGGSIAALTNIASVTLVQPDTSQLKLDDLRRLKPFFERGWLGGSPGAEEVTEGAPTIAIDDPPGWAAVLSTQRTTLYAQPVTGASINPAPLPFGVWGAPKSLGTMTCTQWRGLSPSDKEKLVMDAHIVGDSVASVEAFCLANPDITPASSTAGKLALLALALGVGYVGWRMMAKPARKNPHWRVIRRARRRSRSTR